MSIYVYIKLEKVVILVSWHNAKSLFLPLIAVPSTNLGIVSIIEFLKKYDDKKRKIKIFQRISD